jgi:hypothetical protein
MEAELSATRHAEVPVADTGPEHAADQYYFAATPASKRSCNASGPTTRPGEEDLSDPMHRRTEEHWRGLAGHLAPRDMQAVGKRQPVRVHLGVERGLVYERADGVVD